MNRILLFPGATDASGSSPDAAPKADAAKVVLTPEKEKETAVKAYYDAKTREAKAAVVQQYPVLATIFSPGNHS